MRIVDLGGTPHIWNSVNLALDITIVNLPGGAKTVPTGTIHRFTFVDGDACALPEFSDGAFELAFSNSVIEHVGPADRQAEFAQEVQRLAPAYWVQTPLPYFLLEPHTGVPLWWLLPQVARAMLISRWRKKLPAWSEMVEGTRVLSRHQMQRLFPEATLYTERWAGLPKSVAAFKTF